MGSFGVSGRALRRNLAQDGTHAIPLDAAPSVAAFFTANPFGAWPSPYVANGLPASFPTYCRLW